MIDLHLNDGAVIHTWSELLGVGFSIFCFLFCVYIYERQKISLEISYAEYSIQLTISYICVYILFINFIILANRAPQNYSMIIRTTLYMGLLISLSEGMKYNTINKRLYNT